MLSNPIASAVPTGTETAASHAATETAATEQEMTGLDACADVAGAGDRRDRHRPNRTCLRANAWRPRARQWRRRRRKCRRRAKSSPRRRMWRRGSPSCRPTRTSFPSARGWRPRTRVWSYSAYQRDGAASEGVFFILRWANAGRTPAMQCSIATAQSTVWLKDGGQAPALRPHPKRDPSRGAGRARRPRFGRAVRSRCAGTSMPCATGGCASSSGRSCATPTPSALTSNARRSPASRSSISVAVENREGAKVDRFELVARGPQNRAT